MSINTVFEIVGMLTAVVFILVNLKESRSLTGSFFKGYYRWIIVGAIFMFLGFTTDITGEWLGMSESVIDPLHHLELILFGVIFIYASRILPREASKYMENSKL
ncbi:MAG: hypothetical protein PHG66_06665 [Candidatus Colwellbacteria bacterium]|nr:hypothetical protein [Candidatus Colwellbacteria bacterium]